MKDIKTVAILGIGGVGGYFGGKIALAAEQKKQDVRIYFIARGEHLENIKKNGLILNTEQKQGLVCRPTAVVERFDEIKEDIDLILVCVKSYDLDSALSQIADRISDYTIIIPLLNGIDIYDRVRAKINNGVVLPACVFVGTHIESSGIVTQKGGLGIINFGTDPRLPGVMPTKVIRFFQDNGVKSSWHEDADSVIWEKYVFIAAFGLVTAGTSKTLGEVADDPRLMDEVKAIMNEITAIAKSKGVDLDVDIIKNSLAKALDFPHETKTSYQRDIESAKPNEGDLFGETIIRLGKEHDIATPATETAYRRIIAG